jgi:hypothetical protein
MTVEELIEELKKQDPKAKVLISTEYTPDYIYAQDVIRLEKDNFVLISS